MSAEDLGGMFDPLLCLYEPAKQQTFHIDESLADAIGGWGVFDDELPKKTQNQILDEIRFGPLDSNERSITRSSDEMWQFKFANQDEEIWEQFVGHIKRKRRFLLGSEDVPFLSNPRDWLPEILETTDMTISSMLKFFRAREGCADKHADPPTPFPAGQMGPPPSGMARRGRANPAGISYLYVAEEAETAVAEIRPFVGARVSICTLTPNRPLKVADISRAHSIASPFGDTDLLARVRRTALLNILNRELARPVSPEDSEVEYVPTQYLAEAILDLGYDGIRYRSAVRTGGTNFVFFEPEALTIDPATRVVEVQSIEVTFR